VKAGSKISLSAKMYSIATDHLSESFLLFRLYYKKHKNDTRAEVARTHGTKSQAIMVITSPTARTQKRRQNRARTRSSRNTTLFSWTHRQEINHILHTGSSNLLVYGFGSIRFATAINIPHFGVRFEKHKSVYLCRKCLQICLLIMIFFICNVLWTAIIHSSTFHLEHLGIICT